MNLSNKPIIVFLNSPLASGCDYAIQSMRLLAKRYTVIGIRLGDPYSWKDIWHGLQEDDPAITEKEHVKLIRPFFILPFQRFKRIKQFNYWFYTLLVSLYLKHFMFNKVKPILWFFEPFYNASILPSFSDATIIYDCVDYFDEFSIGTRKEHQALLRRADYVFVNSYVLYEKTKQTRSNTFVVPLGFALNLFIRHLPARKHMPTVGYFGSINSRINYNLIIKVCTELKNVKFILAGNVEKKVFDHENDFNKDLMHLIRLPNVQWLGKYSKTEIPELMKTCDIGIIPYDTNNLFNKYCFPMKTMEYLYSGKPIVSTDITELQRYPSVVSIATTADQFSRAITYWIKHPPSVALKKEMQRIATANSWDAKIEKILSLLEKDSS